MVDLTSGLRHVHVPSVGAGEDRAAIRQPQRPGVHTHTLPWMVCSAPKSMFSQSSGPSVRTHRNHWEPRSPLRPSSGGSFKGMPQGHLRWPQALVAARWPNPISPHSQDQRGSVWEGHPLCLRVDTGAGFSLQFVCPELLTM